ncbi:unnamed protein product [Leuciscus chuanchicus]
MTLYITLGLITVSFSTVFALRCYQCKYEYNSSCKQNLTKCPLQCGSITIYNNDSTLDSSEKSCTDPALCVTDAIHLGPNETTFNPQCCDTDLCNTEEAPGFEYVTKWDVKHQCRDSENVKLPTMGGGKSLWNSRASWQPALIRENNYCLIRSDYQP